MGCFLQVESMHGQGQPPSICPSATKAAIQHLPEVTAHCAVRRGALHPHVGLGGGKRAQR